jgi:hypothetical protein
MHTENDILYCIKCALACALRHIAVCRLCVTFSYNVPAVGDERGKRIAATQIAVLKVSRQMCVGHFRACAPLVPRHMSSKIALHFHSQAFFATYLPDSCTFWHAE